MADRIGQIRAIERIEVKLADALARELFDLLNGHRGRDQSTGVGIIGQPSKRSCSQLGT